MLFLLFQAILQVAHTSDPELVITIKSAAKNHESRLKDIADTWLQWIPKQTFVISDSFDPQINEIFHDNLINSQCLSGHDRKQLSCKMALELKVMSEKRARWSCHFDDDNYVNVPKLKSILRTYDHRKRFYIGKLSTGPITAYPKKGPFYFATGGAGICLSQRLLLDLEPYLEKFEKISHSIQLPDDVTLGYIINYLLGVNVTESEFFHSHFDSLANIPIGKLRLQASLSGLADGSPIHSVRLPAARDDPLKFRAIHKILQRSNDSL